MTLSPAQLSLVIGAAGVALLLFLILRLKLQPFLALLVVSLGVGLAAGIAPDKLPTLIETGVGSTLGHVALIIALGAMIGRLVEVSGGADRLASELVQRFGPSRAAVGLAVAGLLVGIPVFFEVGVVMLMPLAVGTARRTGRPLPGLALPLCIVLLIVHALLPPHPGAVAAAGPAPRGPRPPHPLGGARRAADRGVRRRPGDGADPGHGAGAAAEPSRRTSPARRPTAFRPANRRRPRRWSR